MPNWCENFVTFSHADSKKVDELEQAAIKGEVLQYLHTMPEELEGTTAPSEGLNWYGWCTSNWGTKWDFGPDDVSVIDRDVGIAGEAYISFPFYSAWSPPIGAYEHAVENGWEVTATYVAPAMHFIGEFVDGEDNCYSLDEAPEGLKSDYDWVYEDIAEWERENAEA